MSEEKKEEPQNDGKKTLGEMKNKHYEKYNVRY